jgi:hypothetical protein
MVIPHFMFLRKCRYSFSGLAFGFFRIDKLARLMYVAVRSPKQDPSGESVAADTWRVIP